ncbi:MAG: hypothetical protein WA082_01695 [Candidatus Moraniibacteriota bacterium]
MEVDVTQLGLLLWTNITQFFEHSTLFLAVKFFLFIYVAVLFVDIVLILVFKGLSSDLKTALYGTERPLVSKNKLIKRWEAILSRLESGNPSQYKVALLEADALADEILDGIGYKGVTMTEKLAVIKGGQLETKDLLAAAHEVRNQIVHDATFTLSHDEAEQHLESYRQFFDEVELF